MRHGLFLVALIAAVAQFSCGNSDDATRNPSSADGNGGAEAGGIETLSEDELAQRLEELDREINVLVTDKRCTRDDQCKYTAYGNKACGGPHGYHVYSTRQTDEAVLQARVTTYNAVDRRLDEIRQISDCEMAVEPSSVSCVGGGGGQEGTCTAQFCTDPDGCN